MKPVLTYASNVCGVVAYSHWPQSVIMPRRAH